MSNPTSRLPDYAPQLRAFHRAFAQELRSIVHSLPLTPNAQVLDLACGDGVYAGWFAQRLGPNGRVIAFDRSRDWLALAERELSARGIDHVELQQGDAGNLPFAPHTFDAVWCAQSLYSLSDIPGVMGEMVRVLRPGGLIAVLENDTFHHLLFPWPVDLEMQVRVAELRAFRAESNSSARYYVGRWLTRLLRASGVKQVRERIFASVRQQPLGEFDRMFLGEYLQELRERVAPWMRPKTLARFDRLADPCSRRYLLNDPAFCVVCVDRLVCGRKPRGIQQPPP